MELLNIDPYEKQESSTDWPWYSPVVCAPLDKVFSNEKWRNVSAEKDGKAMDKGAVKKILKVIERHLCRQVAEDLDSRKGRALHGAPQDEASANEGRLRRGNHQGAGKTESSTLSGRSLDYRNKNTASSTSSSTSSTGWFSLRRDEGQSRPESERQNARKQA